jgi:hypothetical protein
VLTVSQNDGDITPVYFEQNLKMDMAAADAGASTSVQPGVVKVTTQLSVMYELK